MKFTPDGVIQFEKYRSDLPPLKLDGYPAPEVGGYIMRAFNILRTQIDGKNEDYKIDGEFSNFTYASGVSGVPVIDGLLNQIAIKLGRIKGLRGSVGTPNNEALEDSFQDLAGYAVILYAYVLSEGVE